MHYLPPRLLRAIALSVGLSLGVCHAAGSIKVGVLSDMSGPYADFAGMGAVVASTLAIEDFKQNHPGVEVELLQADHQNKPDNAVAIARRWYDREGVNAIVELVHSASALAVIGVARDLNKVALISGSSNSDLFGKACTPNSILWTYDSWSLSATLAGSAVGSGGKNWFFLTSDSVSGTVMERDFGNAVKAAGGGVIGSVRVPINAPDMASFLLQAQAAKPDVIAFAMGGSDFANALKQAQEFNITRDGTQIVAPVLFDTDIHGLGLSVTKKLRSATAFYWDMNDDTRAFATRFAARHRDAKPTMVQAGVYSAVLHYLRAAATVKNPEDGAATVVQMKSTPTDDPLFGKGSVRVDGRKLHPMYVFDVKTPAESKAAWDYLRIVDTVPSEKAMRPLALGECPLAAR